MWAHGTGENETTMIAIINTLLFIISIAWFFINVTNNLISPRGKAWLWNTTSIVWR
jgi:predicted esterase